MPAHEGWLFLAAVMDLYSRKIVGWSMRDDLKADLVVDALAMAVTRRRPPAGLVHHSDRGSLGDFKGSSQHGFVVESVVVERGLRRGFSNRGSCVVGC